MIPGGSGIIENGVQKGSFAPPGASDAKWMVQNRSSQMSVTCFGRFLCDFLTCVLYVVSCVFGIQSLFKKKIISEIYSKMLKIHEHCICICSV